VAYECEAAKAAGRGAADWAYAPPGQSPAWPAEAGARWALRPRLAALHQYNEQVGRPEGSWWDAPLVSAARGAVLVHKGWARYNATQLAALLAVVDVALVNYGHHYAGASREEYAADMHALFSQLATWVRAAPAGARTALFRETGAQHFIGSGGAFSSWDQAHPKLGDRCSCAPLSGESNQITGWNEAVRALASVTPEVKLVPFYALTAPRHDMHEGPFCGFGNRAGPQPCCDCTHYCYTPQLWKRWFSDLFTAWGGEGAVASHALPQLPHNAPGHDLVHSARERALERIHRERAARLAARAAVAGGREAGPEADETDALAALTRAVNEVPPAAEAAAAAAAAAAADDDVPPGPEPPAQKFGKAGAQADADELAAIEALLAGLEADAGAPPPRPPSRARGSSADAPPEAGETPSEADEAAWYNTHAKRAKAPPGQNGGAAALAAMRPAVAALLLAALEEEEAAGLLFNASGAAWARAALAAMPIERARAVVAAASPAQLAEGKRIELLASLSAGEGASAAEAEAEEAAAASPAAPASAGPALPSGAGLEPAAALALLRAVEPEVAAALLANMSVMAAGAILAELPEREAAEALVAGADQERRAEMLGARGSIRESRGRRWPERLL